MKEDPFEILTKFFKNDIISAKLRVYTIPIHKIKSK